MDLIKMLESGRHLPQDDGGVAAVHLADVIAFKRVHEALSHVIRLRAAYRRVHRLDAQILRQCVRVFCPESAAIIGEKFKLHITIDFRVTEAGLDALDQHIAHGFSRQPLAGPCAPRDDLAIAAVLQEDAGHDLPVITADLEAIGAPASIRFGDGHHAVMDADIGHALGRLRQQQRRCLHHAIKPLVVKRRQARRRAAAIDHGASTSVAVGRQLANLGAHRVNKRRIGNRITNARRLAIGSFGGTQVQSSDVRARHAHHPADRLHRSSVGNNGTRAMNFFDRAISTASFRISASNVFLPNIRWSCAISARARCQFTGRHHRFAGLHCRKRTFALEFAPVEQQACAAPMLAGHERNVHAWFVRFPHQRSLFGRAPTAAPLFAEGHTSMDCLLAVVCIVVFLVVRIAQRPCPVFQAAISVCLLLPFLLDRMPGSPVV